MLNHSEHLSSLHKYLKMETRKLLFDIASEIYQSCDDNQLTKYIADKLFYA